MATTARATPIPSPDTTEKARKAREKQWHASVDKLTEAVEAFDWGLTMQVSSIDLAERLADLNTAARAHIDRLDQGERG